MVSMIAFFVEDKETCKICYFSILYGNLNLLHDINWFDFQIALGVRAPKKYMKWLREQNAEVLQDLPHDDKKFKGAFITHHLLKEASQETTEKLLDVSTSSYNCSIVICSVL